MRDATPARRVDLPLDLFRTGVPWKGPS